MHKVKAKWVPPETHPIPKYPWSGAGGWMDYREMGNKFVLTFESDLLVA